MGQALLLSRRWATHSYGGILVEGLNEENAKAMTAEAWEEQKRPFREARLNGLRQENTSGLEQLDWSEGIPADEVFRRLRRPFEQESS